MERSFFFKNAVWVGRSERTPKTFSVLRGRFYISELKKITLNGKCVNPDTFLPLSSDYEASCDPREEVLSGHRVYVPNFDITSFVMLGENVIAIHFGGVRFRVTVPETCNAVFRINSLERELSEGENEIFITE